MTQLETDILESEVKWAMGRIIMNKASGGDRIPVELFQVLKDDVAQVLHTLCQLIWKLSSGHRTGKGQFSFQSQRKAMPKNDETSTRLHSFHILQKKGSKFSKRGINSVWTENVQTFKLDLQKAEEPEVKLPTYIES